MAEANMMEIYCGKLGTKEKWSLATWSKMEENNE